MDKRTLQVLEFDKIRALLAELTRTAAGRELAGALTPAVRLEEARVRLSITDEAGRFLEREGDPSFRGVGDIRPALSRAVRGAPVDPSLLLGLADTLVTAGRLRRLLKGNEERYPRLSLLSLDPDGGAELEAEIRRTVTPDGEVADGASPELERLRRLFRESQARARGRLEAMTRSARTRPHLQEAIVTLRDGRYVLPVKMESRAEVPGIIHDQSASGATVFVEPLAMVDLNNELRRLELEARREEERVLTRLSALIAARGEGLGRMAEDLARLDFALACGRLGKEMRGFPPTLNDESVIDLVAARHPLLGEGAVPVDVSLGRDFNTLVITGPNTGGKTVTLKTIGLLSLMAMAGLHIPAAEGSRAAVFGRVWVDIGDEQSIEQSLSTFSSHMGNIVRILAATGKDSLVLLDELGAGTDPTEGAVLGMAVLDRLRALGAVTAVTTHLNELKIFAHSHPEMENASVEFDLETLGPTYRLALGVPGRSNAFEIASRLGLDPALVRWARESAGRDHGRLDDLLAAVEDERRALAGERADAARLRRESEILHERLRREEESLRNRRERVLEEARGEATGILEDARRKAAEAVSALRRAREEGGTEGLRAAEATRHELHRARRGLEDEQPESTWEADGTAVGLEPGAAVFIRGLGATGSLEALNEERGEATVRVGVMRVVVPVGDLGPPREAVVPGGTAGSATTPGAVRPRRPSPAWEKSMEVAPEIHLRRLTVDEALDLLDKYLDDAVLAGLDRVRIIHGKGTGTLRRAVNDFLRSHPLVDDCRPGERGEGGGGVTVASLRAH